MRSCLINKIYNAGKMSSIKCLQGLVQAVEAHRPDPLIGVETNASQAFKAFFSRQIVRAFQKELSKAPASVAEVVGIILKLDQGLQHQVHLSHPKKLLKDRLGLLPSPPTTTHITHVTFDLDHKILNDDQYDNAAIRQAVEVDLNSETVARMIYSQLVTT